MKIKKLLTVLGFKMKRKKKDQYDRLLENLRKKKNKKYDDFLKGINYRFSGQMLIDDLKKFLKEEKDKMKRLKKAIPEMEKFIKDLEKKRDLKRKG